MKYVPRVVAILLFVFTLVFLVYRSDLLDSSSTNGNTANHQSSTSSHQGTRAKAAGVQRRPFDPVPFRTGWRSDGMDAKLLADVLNRTMSGMDVALLDLQANADMVPWLQSLVADDEFGQAVAECRNRHERQQTARCSWEQDVVVRRDAEGTASVVAVQPRTSPEQRPDEPGTPYTPECKAWAQCVADAWKGRPGQFPHGADDYVTAGEDGSQFIALRTAVHHVEAYGTDAAEYRNVYQDSLSRLEKKIQLREQAYLEAEDDGLRSKNSREGLYHNLLLERGHVEDYRAYLRYLNERGKGEP